MLVNLPLSNSYDVFESIGITQSDFFNQVILLNLNRYDDKRDFINRNIKLIVNNSVNRYTLYSSLMIIFINYLDIPDMKTWL